MFCMGGEWDYSCDMGFIKLEIPHLRSEMSRGKFEMGGLAGTALRGASTSTYSSVMKMLNNDEQ